MLPTDAPADFAMDLLSLIVRTTSQTMLKPPPSSVNVRALAVATTLPSSPLDGVSEMLLEADAVAAPIETTSTAARAANSSFMLVRMVV